MVLMIRFGGIRFSWRWFGRLRGLTIWPVLFALLLAAGCSRPDGQRSDATASPTDSEQVPFHEGEEGAPSDSHPGISQAADKRLTEAGLPFREPQGLPAGTLLTVRLKNPISAQNPGASGTFDAVVDEPVLIEGNTRLPRGTNVSGRVESARSSNVKRNRGYVRLTLDSIDLAGRDVPLQTSSLFVKGDPDRDEGSENDAPGNLIHLEKGRRLTFRLTEPVYLASEQPIPGR